MMNRCESNSERLSALADSELGGIAAWRLRRHVAVCAACAGELRDWERMNAIVWSTNLFPNAVAETIPALPRVRRPLSSKIAVMTIAVAIAGGLFYGGPTRRGNPMTAEASVERAISDVRTATWRVDVTILQSKTGEIYSKMRQDLKARLDPPALMWTTQTLYKRNNSKKFSFDSGSVRLDENSWTNYISGVSPESITIDHDVEKYVDMPLSAHETPYQRVRRYVFGSIFEIVSPDWKKSSMSSPQKDKYGFIRKMVTPRTSRLVIHNGRHDYEISETYRLVPGNLEFHNTVWADAGSFWIDEAELIITDLRTGQVHVKSRFTDFQYNKPLTDADFVIPTAPGTLVHESRKSRSKAPNTLPKRRTSSVR